MQHKCVVTVIDKKVFPDLQEKYLADPTSGACPFYNVGDRFVFERYGGVDTFWTMGKGTQCSEAWDCISRYVYAALQGGAIMRGWTNDPRLMIACCNDGTRPVVFKIERVDYKVVVPTASLDAVLAERICFAFRDDANLESVEPRLDKGWVELVLKRDAALSDEEILSKLAALGCSARVD